MSSCQLLTVCETVCSLLNTEQPQISVGQRLVFELGSLCIHFLPFMLLYLSASPYMLAAPSPMVSMPLVKA